MPRKNVCQIQKMTAPLITAIGSLIEVHLDTKAKTKEVQDIFDFCKDPFNNVKSEYKFLKALKNKICMNTQFHLQFIVEFLKWLPNHTH